MAGIASKNLFDLLGDDAADPDQAPTPAKADKAVKGGKAAPASQPTATQQEDRSSRGGARGRGGPRRSGGESGGYRERPPRASEEGGDDYRGRGRGRGAPRRGRARENRQPYDDRHSKTGVTDHEKQVAHGWGGNTGGAEWEDEKAGEAIAKSEEAGEGETKPKSEGEANGEPEAEPAEPEPKVKSLDDYLAEQAEKRLQVSSSLEARKANEGASKKWSDAKEFTRTEEAEFMSGAGAKKTRERAKKEKTIVELDGEAMRPKDEPSERRGGRGRGGRGDRGGGDRGGDRGRGDRGRGSDDFAGRSRGRGGRGRGEARGDGGFRGAERGFRGGRGGRGGHAPNVLDTSAFPSLGS